MEQLPATWARYCRGSTAGRASTRSTFLQHLCALAEEEYDKIAPVIACTLPALTDSIPERKRKELAGEVTRELQVVGNAASIAIRTWVRNNDKTTGGGAREEYRVDRAYVHNMEGEPRRT